IFEGLTGKIEQEFIELQEIVRRVLDSSMPVVDLQQYRNILKMLGKLDAEHQDYDRLARKTFKLIDAGKLEQALILLPRIEAEEEDLDHQLEKMLLQVEKFTERAMKTVEQHELFTLKLLVALTDIALIVGTVVAVFMVRRSISRPLDEIVTGLEALSAGDMSVEVKVYSDDEIGAVAKAYAVFKSTLIKLKSREAELESSRRRFKNLVESTNVVPWEFDPKTMRFIYVGPQAVGLFGYRIEDWYAEGFRVNVIHADDREEAIRICNESARRCEDHDFEYRIMTADGGEVWVRDVSSVVVEDGHAMMFRGVFIDITAKKNSEVELRESEQRFKDIAEVSSDWIWECDEKLRFSYLSERFTQVTGVPKQRILGKTRHEVSKDSVADWDSHLADLEARRPFREFRYAITNDDGEKQHWMISGTPVFDAAGVFKGYRGTGADRTAEVRAQAELVRQRDQLQESQELLSKSFRASPVAMVISSPDDGAYIDVNDAWCAMLGYSRQEAMASSALEFGIWTDASSRDRFVARIGAEGSVSRLETRFRTKDGRLLDVLVSGEQVEIGGQPRLLVVTHDITERKSAEKELITHRDHLQELVDMATQELKAKAVELNEALGKEKELNELQRQFVSMASHEFRTPLSIIDSTAQRLKSRLDSGRFTPDDAHQRIEKIRAAVRRMTRLMDSTLAAARMQEGKIEIKIEPCDISKVVKEVCTRQQEISETHVISCDLVELPETIQADSGSVEQILANLLSNAVKYAPDAPDIEVTARTQGDQVVISVRDYGIGIDADELDNIGERFFRARTSTGIAGTGIGLNLARTLVQMHGGTTNLESKKGEGSTFTIRLPIAGPDLSPQAETKVA
ncbi:MAG: PAS domain S-box protein, partial [Proteobacteria bacterium]|nr:PAS domain S-box protein [Pseudomonadota bacterium]